MIQTLRFIIVSLVFIFYISIAAAQEVFFTKPKQNSLVESPVEFCMGVSGLILESASKGVNEGAGHHHLLISGSLPKMIKSPLRKGKIDIIHLGGGSECHSVKLTPEKYKIRTLFANGAHVPFYPAITSTVKIQVK